MSETKKILLVCGMGMSSGFLEVIPDKIYGMIDGKGLIEFIQNSLFKE